MTLTMVNEGVLELFLGKRGGFVQSLLLTLKTWPIPSHRFEVTYTTRACDVMQDNLSCLPVEAWHFCGDIGYST